MGDKQEDAPGSKRHFETMNNFGSLPLEMQVQSPVVKFARVVAKLFNGPIDWVREIISKYRGPPYPYYHRKFNRVPDISECYSDDFACIYEADKQFLRDRKIEVEIVKILQERFYRCSFYERAVNEWEYDHLEICKKERLDLTNAQLNLFIKYGELGHYQSVIGAFMKQKHRLIYERRKKQQEEAAASA